MQSMKLNPILVCVLAQDLTSPILKLYLPSSVKITSVKLEADNTLVIITISSIPMIQSGMVRDAGVPVLVQQSTVVLQATPSINYNYTDNIELRLCGDEVISNEDTPIEIVKMYIR